MPKLGEEEHVELRVEGEVAQQHGVHALIGSGSYALHVGDLPRRVQNHVGPERCVQRPRSRTVGNRGNGKREQDQPCD